MNKERFSRGEREGEEREIMPSKMREKKDKAIFSSEQSACYQRPLFSYLLSFFLPTILILLEGIVVGLQNFAWAPNSQKYQDSPLVHILQQHKMLVA